MAKKLRTKTQVAANRTLVSKPGHEEQVAKLAGEMMRWTEAQADTEKGIMSYQCVRDQWEPQVFHFWERYETATAFARHSGSPRMVELMEQVVPHLERPMGVALYTWDNGKLGPASIQEGPKGEGGLDDATGASGAAGGASYKQTSRAFDLTKVNEHEEAERDKKLLNAMGGGAAVPVPGQPQPQQPGGKEREPAGAGRFKLPPLKLNLPPGMPKVADLAGMAAGLKDGLVSSLGRLLKK